MISSYSYKKFWCVHMVTLATISVTRIIVLHKTDAAQSFRECNSQRVTKARYLMIEVTWLCLIAVSVLNDSMLFHSIECVNLIMLSMTTALFNNTGTGIHVLKFFILVRKVGLLGDSKHPQFSGYVLFNSCTCYILGIVLIDWIFM